MVIYDGEPDCTYKLTRCSQSREDRVKVPSCFIKSQTTLSMVVLQQKTRPRRIRLTTGAANDAGLSNHPSKLARPFIQSTVVQRTDPIALNSVKRSRFTSISSEHSVDASLNYITCGCVSRDFAFDCIPHAHKTLAIVTRPSFPRAGDAIHPALRKRGSGQRDY